MNTRVYHPYEVDRTGVRPHACQTNPQHLVFTKEEVRAEGLQHPVVQLWCAEPVEGLPCGAPRGWRYRDGPTALGVCDVDSLQKHLKRVEYENLIFGGVVIFLLSSLVAAWFVSAAVNEFRAGGPWYVVIPVVLVPLLSIMMVTTSIVHLRRQGKPPEGWDRNLDPLSIRDTIPSD